MVMTSAVSVVRHVRMQATGLPSAGTHSATLYCVALLPSCGPFLAGDNYSRSVISYKSATFGVINSSFTIVSSSRTGSF